MEHPPRLALPSVGRRTGSGGGLWRRVQRRPIRGCRRRRTAHVYRQHSAGRGSDWSKPRTDWSARRPEPESPNGRGFDTFRRVRAGDRTLSRAERRGSTYLDVISRARVVFAREGGRSAKSCAKRRLASCTRRRRHVFPPPAELGGSSGENKQVERRKIVRRVLMWSLLRRRMNRFHADVSRLPSR